MTKRLVAVVVDPLGSGSHLWPLFKEHGWGSVAVITSGAKYMRSYARFRPDHYAAVVDTEQLPEILDRLEGFEVAAVMPGTETGVELADAIAAQLGVPGNGIRLSSARRDKAAMADQLRMAGVPAAKHAIVSCVEELRQWTKEHDQWPVIVKPRTSAGADGVALCTDLAAAEAAFNRIIGQTNQLGSFNDSVLCQEFLQGQQYVVNSVSVDGHHYIGEIWQFDTTYHGTYQTYDKQFLLEPYGQVQDSLVSYVLDVLDALDISRGAAHAEVMMTKTGPVLIEIAARMTGLIHQEGLLAATGHNHITLTAECYTAPQRILSRSPRYSLKGSLGIVGLRSPIDGYIMAGEALNRLRSLPSFIGVAGGSLAEGVRVRQTNDLFSSPGLAYLQADDRSEIEDAIAKVREIESEGLYGHSPGVDE